MKEITGGKLAYAVRRPVIHAPLPSSQRDQSLTPTPQSRSSAAHAVKNGLHHALLLMLSSPSLGVSFTKTARSAWPASYQVKPCAARELGRWVRALAQ